MKRTVWMAAAIACATTLSVAAQTPSTTTSRTMDKPADAITVTGCLQEGSRSSTGATSTASTTSGSYILANATMGSGSSSSTAGTTAGTTAAPTTAGTTGTTGTTTAGSTARPDASYVLDGRESDLKNHVGHRIEVSGTLESADKAAASSPTATTTSGSASSRMDTSSQRLKVSSVRMIAAECSAK
jgi:hypothetical protein